MNFVYSKFKNSNKIILRYFFIKFTIYISTAIITFLILKNYPEYTTLKGNLLMESIGVNDITNWNIILIFIFIFAKNTLVSSVAILSGKVPFIFLPLGCCLYNAYNIGLCMAMVKIWGYDVIRIILFSILPHGIIEIPAIIYAVSIGSYICKNKTFKILKKDTKVTTDIIIKERFIYIILPALFIAAIIETFITPKLMMLM